MTIADYILFAAVLAAGIGLLIRAKSFDASLKTRFENEAFKRLDRYLSSLDGDTGSYRFFTLEAGSVENWIQVDLHMMRAEIQNDCKTKTPDTFDYQKARFSVTSDQQEKVIYYVVGTDSHRFGI